MFKDDDPIEPSGPRDANLLASALMRPSTGLGDVDKYTTIEKKAAALFHSMVMNHPFHNGNKRTALVSTLVFLDRNGTRMNGDVAEDEIFDLVTSVAAGTFPDNRQDLNDDDVVSEIAAWFRERTVRRQTVLPVMDTSDFLEKCQLAGGHFRESGPSWIVFGPNGRSIRIGRDTRRLEGNVVRRFASQLGLAGALIGVYLEEFQEGVSAEQVLLLQFRNLLKRLANA